MEVKSVIALAVADFLFSGMIHNSLASGKIMT